jgi:hypothetical protein
MPACRPKPVLRKSLATGGRGRGRARDAGQPAAVPGARQHGEAAGVTAPHPGQAGDEPAGGRAEQAAGAACRAGTDAMPGCPAPAVCLWGARSRPMAVTWGGRCIAAVGQMISRVPPPALPDLRSALRLACPARPLPAWLPLTLAAGDSVSPPVHRPGLQTVRSTSAWPGQVGVGLRVLRERSDPGAFEDPSSHPIRHPGRCWVRARPGTRELPRGRGGGRCRCVSR